MHALYTLTIPTKENSSGIVSGIHTCSLYTELHGLHVSLLVYLQKFHFSPTPQQYICRNESLIFYFQARHSNLYSRTYIAAHYPCEVCLYIYPICIHGCTNYPQLSTFMYTCVQHVNNAVTTTSTPLDRRLDSHALTAHTYRSVEAYRSMHYHSSKWHLYNFMPYGRRKENIAYRGVEVYDPFITTQVASILLHAVWTTKGKTPLLVVLTT